jgi:hypothetical protein
MNSIYIFSTLVGIVISCLILKYVYDLEKEKCECSEDWKRTYIKYFSSFIILVGVVTLFGCTFPKLIKGASRKVIIFMGILGFLISMGSIVYLYALYMFSHNLIRHKECPCSESHLRTFVYYYSIIVILLYAFFIFAALVASFIIKDHIFVKQNLVYKL